jgi:shikimate dehydrogenase
LVSVSHNFMSSLTASFAMPAAENPTVAVMDAVFAHHGLNARYLNCEVTPESLGDAVRGALAMGFVGFNCSLPHKVKVIEFLDELAPSASIIRELRRDQGRTTHRGEHRWQGLRRIAANSC